MIVTGGNTSNDNVNCDKIPFIEANLNDTTAIIPNSNNTKTLKNGKIKSKSTYSITVFKSNKYLACSATYTRNFIRRCTYRLLKMINVRRCVLGLCALTFFRVLYYNYCMENVSFIRLTHTRPVPLITCHMLNNSNSSIPHKIPNHQTTDKFRTDPRILVFVETNYSHSGQSIAILLVHTRMKYKIEVSGKRLPILTFNGSRGRYSVIVFENLDKYLHMDKWNREILDKYCREYSVGIIGFVTPSEETLVAAQLNKFPVYVNTNLRLHNAQLNPESQVLRLTRAGEILRGPLPGYNWSTFQFNHTSYEPIEWAQQNPDYYTINSQQQILLATIIKDHGHIDGIQKILFGSSLRFWLHRLIFLDALSYLSHGQLSISLTRMILVDIDDIFVEHKGRLQPDDVAALITTQNEIAKLVPGFKFNLGFSGSGFDNGSFMENIASHMLIDNVKEFYWFPHMWAHQQPHLYDNISILINEMEKNFAFAKKHGIPTNLGYAVSPHHSGVYPTHEILYEAWKKVWDIKMTSTEEYPHLRLARLRRGFIHRNIMVVPRQTCGLFTRNMYIDDYPNGRDSLDKLIQGGEIFQTIVYNLINIFMTHMPNFTADRLGLYTFESVIKFLKCWTNLKLISAPPLKLGETYFRLYPDEVDPIWGNPCLDPKHSQIWSNNKSCDKLPKFLVIGPQKTGTTALYTFLNMHPNISSNNLSTETFEEIQFFHGNNYYNGIDWYMNFFKSNKTNLFEKSANYFDGPLAPKRAHALLPNAKIIAILISPAKRAYSWYQHIKAHGKSIAENYTFREIITANDLAPKKVKLLRDRCLMPGKYAHHIERWLAYYSSSQIRVIDGDLLKSNPAEVMADIQRFLKIQPLLDYNKFLRFDPAKGFFCQISSEKNSKCLGKSKGRLYPPMDKDILNQLKRYYLNDNIELEKLYKRLGIHNIPQWLKDDLSIS